MREIDRHMAWMSNNKEKIQAAANDGSADLHPVMQKHLDLMVAEHAGRDDQVLCAIIPDSMGYLRMVSLSMTVGVERVYPGELRRMRPICLFVARVPEARVLRVAFASMTLALERLRPGGVFQAVERTEENIHGTFLYMTTVSGFIGVLPQGTATWLQWSGEGGL